MGCSSSRTVSVSAPRTSLMHNQGRYFTSTSVCGCLSSSRRMEGCPAELLTDSAKNGYKKKFKLPVGRRSDLSLGNGKELVGIKIGNVVSTERCLASESPAPRADVNSIEFGNKGKCSSVVDNSIGIGTANTSNTTQPFPCSVSANEIPDRTDSLQINQELDRSSSVHFDCHEEPFLDEISVENNVSDEVDFSHSDLSSSSSGSPYFHMLRDDVLQEAIPPRLSFSVSAREGNQQDGSLLQVDVVNVSSNVLPSSSSKISSREARRNGRRLFWDAFSRRTNRSHTDSRTPVQSHGDSGSLRYNGRSPDSSDDEIGGDVGSRTPGYNELQRNSRAEDPTMVCPRGMHSDIACSCSSSFAEESGTRTGVSRIVMLAEALFEVLDQIHQHPMSMSLSVISLPAPVSVVDSFPVRTHSNIGKLQSPDDIPQCYICLCEYEEGDEIRVLPCEHEYHMSCVDKWLKEIHGVCPVCRRDVREGFNNVV